MDATEFRKRGKEIIDYIANYLETINERRVTPDVAPGYLRSLITLKPPHESEDWDTIMQDFENFIMPGITHWQHPKFHAYFPAGNSYSSILGELLSTGLGINGFSWATSPACTELETIIMHWLGRMSGLPDFLLPYSDNLFETKSQMNMTDFNADLNNNASGDNMSHVHRSNTFPALTSAHMSTHGAHCGGGVLLGSASECVLVSVLTARNKAITQYRREHLNEKVDDSYILSKLVAYTSKMAHACVTKAASIALVKIRQLDYDADYSMRGQTLQRAIQEDLASKEGLIPFYVCGTFGTTGCCSYDNIEEIGPICVENNIHLHIDAAYAGNALICEELRDNMKGIEYVNSFSFNPNKWMLVNYDCSCLWIKDKYILLQALSNDPSYLQYKQMEKAIDYRNWGISLSRRFKSLKLWFTIRTYGINGLKKYIRNHVKLAREFAALLSEDERFELIGKVTLGLVCFRIKDSDVLTKNLLYTLNDSGKIHMIPAKINNKFVIRFCVNYENTTSEHMKEAWELIREAADFTIATYNRNKRASTTNSLLNLPSMGKRNYKYFVKAVSDTHTQCMYQMRSIECMSTIDDESLAVQRKRKLSMFKSEDNLNLLDKTSEEIKSDRIFMLDTANNNETENDYDTDADHDEVFHDALCNQDQLVDQTS